MEKCGCANCVLVMGVRAVCKIGYDIENCPCKNCLVKVVCGEVCKDILKYCDTYR